MLIKYIYILFTGVLLAIFIAVGISAFYPAPQAPQFMPGEKGPTAAEMQAQNDYNKLMGVYNRNVSMVSLGFAIVVLVISLLLFQKIAVLADGLLLGGVFILLYSLGLGIMSDDQRYRFIVASIGLVTALALGYFKFIRPSQVKNG